MTQAAVSHRSRLVDHLNELQQKQERAALAELRRGVDRDDRAIARTARYVEPFIRPEAGPWEQKIHYLVAALFALHPEDRHAGSGRYNLGASFRQMRDEGGSESTEKRFIALLDADPEDLHVHLRHAVSLLRAHEVGIDYDQLLHDLCRWQTDERRVQRAWARSYWGALDRAETEPAAAGGATPAAGGSAPEED